MEKEHVASIENPSTRVPWNKGKLVGLHSLAFFFAYLRLNSALRLSECARPRICSATTGPK